MNYTIEDAHRHIIPEHLQQTFQNYVKYGTPPGSFTRAVLSNDFINAAIKADDTNRQILPEIARYVYNTLPEDSWGSHEKVVKHLLKFR